MPDYWLNISLNVFTVTIILFSISFASNTKNIDENAIENVALDYQLSDSTLPKHYAIKLQPYFDRNDTKKYLTFDGIVEITLVPQYNTKIIELNAKNLTIDNSKTLLTQNGTVLTIEKAELFTNIDKYVVTSEEELEQDEEYVLKLSFNGTLNNTDFKGFYKTSYKDGDKDIEFVTTLMELNSARRVLPCYDESGIRATYQLTIKAHASQQTVLSNTAIYGEPITENDWTTTVFENTKVRMPIYLLAFVVSNLRKVSNGNGTMSVYAIPKYEWCAERSLHFGEKVVEELQSYLLGDLDYFNYMDKLDQIGIPDFVGGAMENWGLIAYENSEFLWDEMEATSEAKQNVYLTIAHEITHQWFGNLVSPSWWAHIWLSEGFAQYFQYVISQEVMQNLGDPYMESDWRLFEQFAIHVRQMVFQNDSSWHTRPINSFVESPKEVLSLLDTIAYDKAASIFFMLEHILTKPVFQRGLNTYLHENQESSVSPNNLWDALQSEQETYSKEEPHQVSNLRRFTVHDIGNSWTLQAGYPIVTVTKEGNIVKLEQKRFLTDSTNSTDTLYLIPINYVLQSNLEHVNQTQPRDFLTKRSRSIEVEKADDFIIVNNLQTGYYRVNYDTNNWQKIIDYTQNTENLENLAPVTLSQLIDDSFTFSRYGLLPYKYSLKLTELLQHVDDYIPWYAAVDKFKFLDTQLMGSYAQNNYMDYQRVILNTVYQKVKNVRPDNSTHIEKLTRNLILKRACLMDLQDCIQMTNTTLWEHIQNGNPIVPDDQMSIYCGGVRYADETTYHWLLKRYTHDLANNTIEQKNLILGMGCMTDQSLLKRLIRDSLAENSKIDQTHIGDVFFGMINADANSLEIAVQSFVKQYDFIQRILGEEKTSEILQKFGEKCNLAIHIKAFQKLEKINNTDSFKRDLANLKNEIQTRIDWNDRFIEEINNWLISNNYVANDNTIVLINISLLGINLIVIYLCN